MIFRVSFFLGGERVERECWISGYIRGVVCFIWCLIVTTYLFIFVGCECLILIVDIGSFPLHY